MQSTVNYLWHTDDLLGQGATASVYKARNKVGPKPPPAHRSPLAPRKFLVQSAPCGPPGVCGWPEASGFALRWGDTGFSSGWCFCQVVWDWRERDEDTKPTSGGDGSKSRDSRGGKQGLFGVFLPSSRPAVL